MWPFSKQDEYKHIDDEIDYNNQIIGLLQELYKIGDTFCYLGKIMVVTACYYRSFTAYGYCPVPMYIPAIKANYCDNNGVIHSITFHLDEVMTFKQADIEPDKIKIKQKINDIIFKLRRGVK